MVGSGPAQQAMLSEGSDPANPPKQTFELNLKKMLAGVNACGKTDHPSGQKIDERPTKRMADCEGLRPR